MQAEILELTEMQIKRFSWLFLCFFYSSTGDLLGETLTDSVDFFLAGIARTLAGLSDTLFCTQGGVTSFIVEAERIAWFIAGLGWFLLNNCHVGNVNIKLIKSMPEHLTAWNSEITDVSIQLKIVKCSSAMIHWRVTTKLVLTADRKFKPGWDIALK